MALPRVEIEVTADTRAAEAGLDRVSRSVKATAASASVASGTVTRLGNTFQRNGFAISNAANQFSDLAVQIGAGVSPSRALSQQIPQLTAFMGPLATVVGVTAGVLIGLGGSFIDASIGADKFKEAIDGLEASTEELRKELFMAQEGLDNLAQAAALQEIRALEQEILELAQREAALAEQRGNAATRQRRQVQATLEARREELALLQSQLTTNQNLVTEIAAVKNEAKALADETGRAAMNAEQLARFMRYAVGVNNQGLDAMDPRNPSNTRPIFDGEFGNVSPFDPSRLGSSVGGSGGGSALEVLDEDLTSQEQRVQEHFERVQDLYTGGLSDQLGAYGNYFNNLVSMTGSNNDKLLRLGKAFQAGQSLIDAWGAYTKTLNDPAFVGRPWARVAAAAQVLSAGLGAVNAIKGVSSSGGGGSGGASGGSAGVTQAVETSSAPNTTIQIAGDNFSGASLISLINQLQESGHRIRAVS